MAKKKKTATVYERHQIWDEKCQPLFSELVEILDNYEIPFFAAICVANNGTESDYVVDALVPSVKEMKLCEDYITKHLKVHRGYEVRVPQPDIILDMDSVETPDVDEIIYDD